MAASRSHGKREYTVDEPKNSTAYPKRFGVRERLADAAFAKLFDASSDLITVTDLKDDTLLDANDSFLRTTGWQRGEVIGASVSDLGLWPSPRDWARLAEALQRGPVRNVEVTFMTRAGKNARASCRRSPSGCAASHACSRSSKTPRRGGKRRRNLAASAPWSSGPARRLPSSGWTGHQYVNPAFTQITGYTHEEVLGKNPSFLRPGRQEDPELYRDLWDTVVAGKIWHGELTNRRRDGSLSSRR